MMEALDIINGSRREAYGPPERNFERIASLWSAYMAVAADAHPDQIGLSAIDVCHMLDLVKLARLVETPDHEDSIRDRFGYQGCYVDLVLGDKPVEAVPTDQRDMVWENGQWVDWPPAIEPVVVDFPHKSNGA